VRMFWRVNSIVAAANLESFVPRTNASKSQLREFAIVGRVSRSKQIGPNMTAVWDPQPLFEVWLARKLYLQPLGRCRRATNGTTLCRHPS